MDDTDKIGSDVVSTNGRFNNIWLSSLRGLDNRELSHFFSVNWENAYQFQRTTTYYINKCLNGALVISSLLIRNIKYIHFPISEGTISVTLPFLCLVVQNAVIKAFMMNTATAENDPERSESEQNFKAAVQKRNNNELKEML